MLRRPNFAYRLALILMVGGVAVVAAALAAPGLIEDRQTVRSLPTPGATAEVAHAFEQATPTPPPGLTATPVNNSPIARLVIPSINVDAPVVVLGVDGAGVMESPETPTEVAWYEFSSRPGGGSNIVFAGHVDYYNYGAAVFWELRNLEAGAEITVRLADGTEFSYTVVSLETYSSDAAPVLDIVGGTADEIVTLITCDGSFSHASGEYDSRLVVRAERVEAEQARSN